jgi:beta-glucosidase
MNSRNTLVIGTFGEFPYAESDGDINIPYCKTEDNSGCLYNPSTNPYAPAAQLRTLKAEVTKYDKEVLSTIKEADQRIPLISVLVSGRPMLIDELLALSDATIAAWLPGTSGGQGIVDAIVGNYAIKPKTSPKKNTLSVDWPKDMVLLNLFSLIWKISPPTTQTGQSQGSTTDYSQSETVFPLIPTQ